MGERMKREKEKDKKDKKESMEQSPPLKKLRTEENYEVDQLTLIEVEIEPRNALESKLSKNRVPHCERLACAAGKFLDLLTQCKFELERLIFVFSLIAEQHRYIDE